MPMLLMNTAAWACNNMKRAAIGYNQDPSTQLTEFLVAQVSRLNVYECILLMFNLDFVRCILVV
jgi:hypothetical protein